MKVAERRDLEVLEAVSQNQRITQRTLSNRLGIALGLTNIYLKRLARKGYIKCVNVQSNRILYLITPKGIAEKTRLTYEFMDYSLHLYGQVRMHLRAVLEPYAANKRTRVAIYGAGEAAELAYLALKELGLDLVGVFDGRDGGSFLGSPVRNLDEADASAYDVLIVATFERGSATFDDLLRRGVPQDKLLPLRPPSNREHVER
jgi:DNA-binding MarR family transcriptional regulator